jgi:3-dehydroquinate dehydratase-2
MRILLLNGPNLGRLGQRQPEIYGHATLDEVVKRATDYAASRGATLDHLQSNHEGALIDRIEQLDYDGIVINPGALGHTSYALRDAIQGSARPAVEVHISDVFAREPFRHKLVLEGVVLAQIVGKGVDGYIHAVDILLERAE